MTVGRTQRRGAFSLAALAVVAGFGLISGCQPKAPPVGRVGAFYHDPDVNVTLSSDERELVASIRDVLRQANYPAAELDPALVLAARRLAALYQDLGPESFGRMRNETIQQALLDAGVSDARFFSHMATSSSLDHIAQSLRESAAKDLGEEDFNRLGVGVMRYGFPRMRLIVILFTKRIVLLSPFPKFLANADARSLHGRIAEGYQKPEIFVTRPDGQVVHEPLVLGPDREFLVDVPVEIGRKGRYTVEVAVEGPAGPEMAALFPVDYLERTPPATFVAASSARGGRRSALRVLENERPMTEREAELALVALVNEERSRAGLIALVEHEALTALARAHSRDMAANQFVRHVSASTGDLPDRAERAGIRYRKIGENIAVNTSIRAAHASLVESPAHRENLMDPEYRFVGVGVVRQDGPGGQVQYVVTENFADLR